MMPLALARAAHAAHIKANEIKNTTSDENVATLMDNIIKAAEDVLTAIANGDLNTAISAAEEVEKIDFKTVAEVSPELATVVKAVGAGIKNYAQSAGIDLEALAELQASHPDIAQNLNIEVTLPKITADDIKQAAVEAASIGDVSEAKALADLAALVEQLSATTSSSSTTEGGTGG